MKPVKQMFLHDPENGIWGDCHRAAIASVLELPIDEVPHFYDGPPPELVDGKDPARLAVEAFLNRHGVTAIESVYEGSTPLDAVLDSVGSLNGPDIVYLLCGTSKTGCNHSVVCRGDRIVHDPSLRDAGIVGPASDGYWWITHFGALHASRDAA